jgi:hypothetical protein
LSDFSLKGCTFVVYIVGYSQGFFFRIFWNFKIEFQNFKYSDLPLVVVWITSIWARFY